MKGGPAPTPCAFRRFQVSHTARDAEYADNIALRLLLRNMPHLADLRSLLGGQPCVAVVRFAGIGRISDVGLEEFVLNASACIHLASLPAEKVSHEA